MDYYINNIHRSIEIHISTYKPYELHQRIYQHIKVPVLKDTNVAFLGATPHFEHLADLSIRFTVLMPEELGMPESGDGSR